MPWQVPTLMSQRHEFVQLAVQPGANFSALCRAFDISRKTGYKWCARFRQQGLPGLADRSRRPRRSPRRTADETEAAVRALRESHPAWGGRKLAAVLARDGLPAVPAPSTITAILRRHQLLDPAEAVKHSPGQRFERSAPNELWQMDFKGHFALAAGRCHPLTVLDDHSRYALVLQACANERTATVQTCLQRAFERYGLPAAILTDNGSPWGDGPGHPYTPLGVWLIRLGIRVCHTRPYHPQTNGKDERFHRTLQAEVLRYRYFTDWAECQRVLDDWRLVYNTRRPHESLGQQPPSSRYQLSARPYPGVLPPVEYGPDDQVRWVQSGGRISFQGRQWRVGKAFCGQPVALRPTAEAGELAVFYCHQQIARLALDDDA
jgi:transposase InsO family protein